jgi:excisionase family DNA binding protein
MTKDKEPPPPPTHLTISEIANMYKLSKMTIYRLVHSGLLPYTRIGRSIRISIADFRQWEKDSSR